MIINCVCCGRLKKIKECEASIRRFCSRECYYKHMRTFGTATHLKPNKGRFCPGNPYRFKLGNEYWKLRRKSEGNKSGKPIA